MFSPAAKLAAMTSAAILAGVKLMSLEFYSVRWGSLFYLCLFRDSGTQNMKEGKPQGRPDAKALGYQPASLQHQNAKAKALAYLEAKKRAPNEAAVVKKELV